MSSINRLNQYRIMWLFVYFDLPTKTKKERKAYAAFRKALIQDGFVMMQYSIYARHCSSRENLLVHKSRITALIPPHGHIILFQITDKQFGMMEHFRKSAPAPSPTTPRQLELF